MQSRREFMKAAAVLAGAAGLWEGLEATVRSAAAIEPIAGSTFRDAEHVVILMQENRSFDHVFGTLRGVRGFNDPRALTLANGDPVWVQTNAAGERYAPFRLDFKESKSTWTGSLPHSWTSQVDARNGGLHDNWLNAKRAGGEYAKMPLTLGHYARDDVPFYYALADAFTVCDQHFCSSLSPTLPNRLFLWTGTVREHPGGPAHMRNEQIEDGSFPGWTTFPERLEDAGVSWKVYQNELTVPTGLSQIEDDWLSNYGDNPLEYFPQFRANMHPPHRAYVQQQLAKLPERVGALRAKLVEASLSAADATKLKKQLDKLESSGRAWENERAEFDRPLTPREKAIHEKAFTTNAGDPAYRRLVEIAYKDGDAQRRVKVPEGDVLYQFRDDVKRGALPTVSWLVAPQKLSDHPESAWYGAWYVSESLRILTENPDVWRKTIFILTYDENDGYFDHVPPFVAPQPGRRETGFASEGIDTTADFVELEQDKKISAAARESPVGLGYRVPMVIASPWSRGGCVCSQVFDHTSVLRFLETFLSAKTGKAITETNISAWRRTVCGDLTSAFQATGEAESKPTEFVSRDPFVKQVYDAQFKPAPSGFRKLTDADVLQLREDPRKSALMARQEAGVRKACALPYELYADGVLHANRLHFTIRLGVGAGHFGDRSAGCPFVVYARTAAGKMAIRRYAVAADDQLEDAWPLSDFEGGIYRVEVDGPNGFYREFTGGKDDPIDARLDYARVAATHKAFNGDAVVRIVAGDASAEVSVADASYGGPPQTRVVDAKASDAFVVSAHDHAQWYDVRVTVKGSPNFARRFAGKVETGHWTTSDPAMA